MKAEIFRLCQEIFPQWRQLASEDFDFDDPKGFSSFTMGIRCREPVNPPAVLYRRLEGKENAILDFETEKSVFLTLGENGIAATCHFYDRSCRIEQFYQGRTLRPADLFEPDILRQIAEQLYRLHQLRPRGLPQKPFFDMMHEKWGRLAKQVLEGDLGVFPDSEAAMCASLRELYSPDTLAMVKHCLPDDELTFCHNDSYHGNIMKLDSGEIKLLDFEFSCLNYRAYDFSNLFAETVMQHKQAEYPYFRIADPEFGDRELGMLIGYYLDNAAYKDPDQRSETYNELLRDTRLTMILSDYKYALAAIPLAVKPVQKIRFIPYAHARFNKFKAAYADLFG
ncbi:MAG: phosphotransferase [Gammaproteobacteria bacterium]|nr:MAG: phosphotransferase [Gammaproteobacteria bacterium]